MDLIDLADRFTQLTLMTAYFAGVILAIVFWSRHPRPSCFLLIASALLLVVQLLDIATQLVPIGDVDEDEFLWLFASLDFVVRMIAFGLLVAAVYAGRGRRRTFMDEDEM